MKRLHCCMRRSAGIRSAAADCSAAARTARSKCADRRLPTSSKKLPKLELPEVRVPPPSRDDVIARVSAAFTAPCPMRARTRRWASGWPTSRCRSAKIAMRPVKRRRIRPPLRSMRSCCKQPNGRGRRPDRLSAGAGVRRRWRQRQRKEISRSTDHRVSRQCIRRRSRASAARRWRSRRSSMRPPPRTTRSSSRRGSSDAVLAERELHARLVPLQGIAARSQPRQLLRRRRFDHSATTPSRIAAPRNCWTTCCA